jgi:hypothetical protein
VIDEDHPPILLRSQSSQTPRTVWLEEGDYQTLIAVKENATLTLKHITLQGPQDEYTDITLISTAGNLVLESGASVKDGKKSNGDGTGGVHIIDGGKFTMNKGTISGNKSSDWGGGVRVDSGTFTMYGGVISDNKAFNMTNGGGGGVMVKGSDSQFTMYGGVISDNDIDDRDNGGGVGLDNTTFIMNGGSIRGNKAANSGGVGLTNTSTFTMNGGVISGNSVWSGGGGGGVGIKTSSTFIMDGGVISGNKAAYEGGGVFVQNGTQFAKTGGVIYGSDADNALKNTAGSGKGHAVYNESPEKERNSTAGKDDDLDSTEDGKAGGWE